MAGKSINPAIYDGLDEFATPRQLEYLAAIRQAKSYYSAAKICKVHPNVVKGSMDLLVKRAAKKLIQPHRAETGAVPDGYAIKGTSTFYGEDGKVRGQWVKTDQDKDQQEQVLRAFAASLCEDIKGLAPAIKPPKATSDELMCVYPMGDPHFGMYAWAAESGSDFDLAIAEKLTNGAIDRLVSTAPATSIGVLVNLGDMFHADNQSNQTQSGNQLDVDGRRPKVQQVGLMSMVHCILRMLEKHALVIFRINKGNHDKETSYALALMLSCWFRNEPRVQIELSPAVMWYYRFGKVLLASTHGDTIKGKDMLAIMAADRPEDWGATRFRHCLVGHVHHHDSKEHPGGIVEYFNTMAARDAWHQGQGYRAGRDMRLIVYHREHGEVERHRCDVGMVA